MMLDVAVRSASNYIKQYCKSPETRAKLAHELTCVTKNTMDTNVARFAHEITVALDYIANQTAKDMTPTVCCTYHYLLIRVDVS